MREAGRYGLILVAAGVLLGGAGGAEAAAQKAAKGNAKNKKEESKGAAIVFPAKGNLDPDQGTLEAVFSLSYSFGEPMLRGDESEAWLFLAASIHDSKGGLYWPRHVDEKRETKKRTERDDEGGVAFLVGMLQSRGTDVFGLYSSRCEQMFMWNCRTNYAHFIHLYVDPNKQPRIKINAGEWHTFAATWQRNGSNYDLALYIDGKKEVAYSRPVNPSSAGTRVFDAKDLLYIGDPTRMRGALQTLRISKRPRTSEEIAAADKAGLAKDADTLLLVNADTVSKMKVRRLGDLMRSEKQTIRVPAEGTVFGTLDVVPGRDGQALRFQ